MVPAARTDQDVEVRMPVQHAAPGVQHRQKRAVHPPVVSLEEFDGLSRSGEKQGCHYPIVQLEDQVHLRRQREHHVEMRAVRQPRAHLRRPPGLPRPQAVGAVAVATRTRIDFQVAAITAAGAVVAQQSVAAVCHQVER